MEKFLRFDLFRPGEKDFIEILTLVSEVDKAHSLIIEMPSFPQIPNIVQKDELIRAVGSTTAIEGNPLTDEQIQKAFDRADRNLRLHKLEQEVQNLRETCEFITNGVFESGIKDLSLELIRQIHKITTKDLPEISNVPGKIRTSQVEFGDPPLPSLFPDQAAVERALKGLVEWYNRAEDSISHTPIIKGLLSHYYLSEIHPFFNGNGRTARAIEAFCFLAEKFLHRAFFHILSSYCYKNREEYLTELRSVRATADAIGFVRFGLKGLVEELTIIKEKVKEKVSQLMFIDYVHYLHREKKNAPHKITSKMVILLEILSKSGKVSFRDFISSAEIRGLYLPRQISTRTRNLQYLQENNLIKIIGNKKDATIEANLGILMGLEYRV
jgi:Fic family protein